MNPPHGSWDLMKNMKQITQSRIHVVGTYGLKRPFNQRPATVHPKLKGSTGMQTYRHE